MCANQTSDDHPLVDSSLTAVTHGLPSLASPADRRRKDSGQLRDVICAHEYRRRPRKSFSSVRSWGQDCNQDAIPGAECQPWHARPSTPPQTECYYTPSLRLCQGAICAPRGDRPAVSRPSRLSECRRGFLAKGRRQRIGSRGFSDPAESTAVARAVARYIRRQSEELQALLGQGRLDGVEDTT
jgi:hypothetical protein